MGSREEGGRFTLALPSIGSQERFFRVGSGEETCYGSTAVMFRFGTCPTGMRVISFMDLMSNTDTEFDAALAT